MDNITHAFVGAAMAECALPGAPSPRTRAMFTCVGVVAASAPDVDVLYTGITEEPLGYLLHHRGHTHTLPGVALLGLLIWASLVMLPSTRAAVRGTQRPIILLLAAGLVSHLLMDTANSYGTHLLYPLSTRWVYGDAVFVLEPWLWAILGTALALNASRFWCAAVVVLAVLPTGGLAYVGLLQLRVLAVIVGAAMTAGIAVRAWDRKTRAAAALIATTAAFVAMAGVSRIAKAEARHAVAALDEGEIVDVVSDSSPGVPWCWTVLTLQKANGESDALIVRRATLSLLPRVWPAASCASARLGARWSSTPAASGAIVWHRQWRTDLDELRALAAGNCRVRAWLQFARAPHAAAGRIVDLRYENPIAGNFTLMRIDSGSSGCPAHLTQWELPRRDVLGDPID